MRSLPNQFSVRWTDAGGVTRHKDYDDIMTARKALKWVEDNGGVDADIAVIKTVANKPAEPVDTEPRAYKD